MTARYTGSFLGMLWSYINPFTQFLMYSFIFALIGRGMNIEHFAIHVFSALMVVSLFTETVVGRHPLDRAQRLAAAEERDAARAVPVRVAARLDLPPVAGVRDPRRRPCSSSGGRRTRPRSRAGVLGYLLIIIFALALA